MIPTQVTLNKTAAGTSIALTDGVTTSVYPSKTSKIVTHSGNSTVDVIDVSTGTPKTVAAAIPLASFLNGATGLAFADLASIATYIDSDFLQATT